MTPSAGARASYDGPIETVDPDEPALIAEFLAFLERASARRHPAGPMPRFNQGRHTGCVEAELTVLDGLPSELRVGLFSEPRTYPAWIRFANASSRSDREKDIRGMSIKVHGVEGENLVSGATTQDFVLNSHPVMVAPDARAFLSLLRAMEAGGLRRILYLLVHPRSAWTAVAARGHPTSHLDISYWSTTPYLFGEGRAVKYVARPCAPAGGSPPKPLTDDYLRAAMRAHLARAEACFDFLVQLRTNPRRMPIEDASRAWKESDSPYRRLARIRIPSQDIEEPGRRERCEEVSFDPWHALVEHRPLGSLNRARREIYPAMAELRRRRR